MKLLKKCFASLLILAVVLSFLPSYSPKAATELKDGGIYKIAINFYKDGTGKTTKEESAAGNYIEKTATIKVENGQPYLYVTLKNSAWWKAFATSKTGEHPAKPDPETAYQAAYADTVTDSKNTTANTRVEKIKISSPDQIVYSYMHIKIDSIPGFTYDNWYQVDLGMDINSLETVFEPAPASEVKNGVYKINFQALHATENKASAMARYFDNPAWLKVANGRYTVALTLNDSKTVTGLQTMVNGSLQDVGVVSEDTDAKTKIISFETANLDEALAAHVTYQADMGSGNIYNGKADFRFVFDPASIALSSDFPSSETPTEPAEPADPNDNDNTGSEPAPTKPTKPSTPDKEPQTPTKPTAPTKTEPTTNVDTSKKTAKVDPNKLQDGHSYRADFQINKEATTEKSMMDNYTKKPAIIKVENGQPYLYLTLTSSHWIKSFQTKQNGAYVDAQIAETNAAKDTRVVKYPIASGAAKTAVKTHVLIKDIPGLDYDNEYLVTVALDPDSLVDITGNEKAVAQVSKQAPTSGSQAVATDLLQTESSQATTSGRAALDNNAGAKLTKPDFASESAPQAKGETVKNAKTSDNSQIWLYGILFLGASVYLMRRLQVKNQ